MCQPKVNPCQKKRPCWLCKETKCWQLWKQGGYRFGSLLDRFVRFGAPCNNSFMRIQYRFWEFTMPRGIVHQQSSKCKGCYVNLLICSSRGNNQRENQQPISKTTELRTSPKIDSHSSSVLYPQYLAEACLKNGTSEVCLWKNGETWNFLKPLIYAFWSYKLATCTYSWMSERPGNLFDTSVAKENIQKSSKNLAQNKFVHLPKRNIATCDLSRIKKTHVFWLKAILFIASTKKNNVNSQGTGMFSPGTGNKPVTDSIHHL